MQVNLEGRMNDRFPDAYLIEYPVNIETVPFLHFFPREKFLQVSTIGCNFSCPGCVSEILTRNVAEFAPSLMKKTPDMVVKRALSENCRGIVFSLNEPAVSFSTFRGLAGRAREAGLLVGCATNGYFTHAALQSLAPFLDAAAVGIKGCTRAAYEACGAPSPDPVFRNISTLVDSGIHVEVTVVHTAGSEEEVIETCRRVSLLSPDIPVQVMRFIAFGPADLSLEPAISVSEKLCDRLNEHSRYVYLFNSPGSAYLSTRCPDCGSVVVSRELFGPMGARIIGHDVDWVCRCGFHIPYTGNCAAIPYQEEGMMGGYRPTRALEIIKAIADCLGIRDEQTCTRVWVDFVSHNYIDTVHKKVQDIDHYYEIINHIAELTGSEENGAALIRFLREKTAEISRRVRGLRKPRVLYVMGTPLFVLNENRFENSLVKVAGGEPLNRDLPRTGKPGIMMSPENIIRMDPEVIVISGFLSSPVEDSYNVCRNLGIDVPAVRNNRIIGMPPSWDFGNPRFVLGLAYLATALHPGEVQIDVSAEAEEFYQRWYKIPYKDAKPNRSFFRPSSEM